MEKKIMWWASGYVLLHFLFFSIIFCLFLWVGGATPNSIGFRLDWIGLWWYPTRRPDQKSEKIGGYGGIRTGHQVCSLFFSLLHFVSLFVYVCTSVPLFFSPVCLGRARTHELLHFRAEKKTFIAEFQFNLESC